MHSVFSFEHTEGELTFDLQSALLHAGYIAFLQVEFLDFISIFLRPHQVHAHEHARPVAALCASRSCGDLKNRAEIVFFSAEHVFEFEILNSCCAGFELLFQFFFGRCALFIEVVEHLKIFHRGFAGLKCVGPNLFVSDLAHDLLCLLWIVPEAGVLC